MIAPYFITLTALTRDEVEATLNINPVNVLAFNPEDDGTRVIVNGLMPNDGGPVSIQYVVSESPEDIRGMITAAHEKAFEVLHTIQNRLVKAMEEDVKLHKEHMEQEAE